MMKNIISCYFAIMIFVLSLGCNSGSNSESIEKWVTVSGRVTYQEQGLKALVLLDDQHSFITRAGDGIFEVEAPLDKMGFLTLKVFAAGMAPYKQIIMPPDTTGLIVQMSQPSPESPDMTLTAEISPAADDWVKIAGNLSAMGLPVNSMVIANGQFTFSNSADGSFEMVVPPESDYKTIQIMCFADDFKPYMETIAPLSAETEAFATIYGSVKLIGTVQTIVRQTPCSEWDRDCFPFPKLVPVGATINANGYQTVANPDNGQFELEVPAGFPDKMAVAFSIVEHIRYTTIIDAEYILPWEHLSVSPTKMSMLSETTEIVHITGGKAPYMAYSTNSSVASATTLGKLVTISGASTGETTIVITDSESYTVNIEVAVASEGTGEVFWVPVKKEYDRNGDGRTDWYTYYTYSEKGLLREEYDYDNNGTMDQVQHFSYDDNGLHCTAAYEYSNSGNLIGHRSLSYDDHGNLMSAEDSTGIKKYTYNDQGKVTIFEIDHHKDGIVDYIQHTTYNSHGHMVREETDEDNDGTVDIVHTYATTYDDNGNLTQYKSDVLNDGTIEKYGYFEYNEDGSLSAFNLDYNRDGKIDRSVYFGPNNRIYRAEQFFEWNHSYKWERRYFNKKLNLPDLFTQWIWSQL